MGPLAGPVVASAVIVRDFSFSSRVDDSKALTPQEREEAFAEILAKATIGVGIVGHAVIDEINIFQATMRAMAEAVMKLERTPDCVLVDGNRAPRGVPLVQFPIVRGDTRSFSIACASIVAKVTRDRIMAEYDAVYPDYGFRRHKGYCTPEHRRVLKKIGPCPIHRRSFRY